VFNGHNEDFGIVPIEANASGKPVLARNDGFPGTFVKNGENGILHDGTKSDIKKTVRGICETERMAISTDTTTSFSIETFQSSIRNKIVELMTKFYNAT
jgi:glycosyltransferase involved in cell wall biosynthesis